MLPKSCTIDSEESKSIFSTRLSWCHVPTQNEYAKQEISWSLTILVRLPITIAISSFYLVATEHLNIFDWSDNKWCDYWIIGLTTHTLELVILVLLCTDSYVSELSVTCLWCDPICRAKMELFISKPTHVVIGIRLTYALHLLSHCTVTKCPLLFSELCIYMNVLNIMPGYRVDDGLDEVNSAF